MGSYVEHIWATQAERFREVVPLDQQGADWETTTRAALIVALDRIAALEARVAQLEAAGDRRESYEAEQAERNG